MRTTIAQSIGVAAMCAAILGGVSWQIAPLARSIEEIRSDVHDIVQRVQRLELQMERVLVRLPLPGGEPPRHPVFVIPGYCPRT